MSTSARPSRGHSRYQPRQPDRAGRGRPGYQHQCARPDRRVGRPDLARRGRGADPPPERTRQTTPKPSAKPASPVTLYPTPKPAKPLSKIVDIASAYQEQDSCDPVAKPGVTAFMNLMLATYKTGVSAGIVRSCSVGAASEHKEGRAWDWSHPRDNEGPRDPRSMS